MKINHLIYSFCWMWQLKLSRLTTIEWNYMPFYRFRNGFRAWKNKLNEKFEDNEKEKKRKERNKKSEKPKDAAKENYIHCDVLFWIGAIILFKFSTHCKRVLINKKRLQKSWNASIFFCFVNAFKLLNKRKRFFYINTYLMRSKWFSRWLIEAF